MEGTEGPAVQRVASADGTEIAWWTSGKGPPLLLVHGAPADHTRWAPLLPHLEAQAAVHAMDRRGRGASGDGPEYRLAREFEDVAAVIDAVAEAARSKVDLYGHSFGGLVAFGGAALTGNVRSLVLYEGWPPVDPSLHTFPPGVGERLDALLESGDRDAAAATVLRELAGLSDADLRTYRAQPAWQARADATVRITREVRAIREATFDPDWAARITVPTLLVTGADSRDPATVDLETVAAALPDARIAILHGQQHVADVLAPEIFAERLLAFLRDQR